MSCKRETVHICIVHLLRHSLDFVSYKDRKLVAAALKDIYRALDAAAGEAALAAFEAGEWGRRYPATAQSWRRAWGEVIPFCAFRRGSPDPVHDECHRGSERHAPPGCARPRSLPDRRGCAEAALPGLEPLREGVEDGPA